MVTRVYGVSFGNGNDGVSQMFPSYLVRTDDPYKLASAALLATFNDAGQLWAKDAIEVDGESDYTVSATIYEGPEGETEFGAAWMICEVFPCDESDHTDRMIYDSPEACFGSDVLALASD